MTPIRPPAAVAALLEPLPAALLCLTAELEPQVLLINRRGRERYGLNPADLATVAHWIALTYPNTAYRRPILSQWQQAVAAALEGGNGSLQCGLLNGRGQRCETLLEVSRLGDHLVVSLQDLEVRSRRESTLADGQRQRAEAALALTEAIPVGTYTMVKRPDQPVAYFAFMSERFLELTGLDRQRARSNPLEAFACVHPDDYDAWLKRNAEAFDRIQPFYGKCRVVVRGETRWISAESVPRSLSDGSTVWEGVLIDITEQVRAQERLAAGEQRWRRILDNLSIPVASLAIGDPTATLQINRRFSDTFGYGPGELTDLGSWWARSYLHPACRQEADRRWQLALARARASHGLVAPEEYRVTCADGTEKDVLISATLSDGLLVMTLIDISERRRSERDLTRLRRREKELEDQRRLQLENKLRTSLTAAAVAHEIKQPLSTMLLNCQLALARCQRATPPIPGSTDATITADLEPFLQDLVNDANRVVRIMEKMRSLLRNVQTDPLPVDLANVIDSALLGLRAQLRQQAVQVDTEGLDQPCLIGGDADQLQAAVSNLLRNAIEALAAAPLGRIRIRLGRLKGWAALTLDDNGCGMAKELVRLQPLESTKADGTGLGLYVVQTAVENHRGTIHFDTSPLGGTRVSLRFPLLAQC
ncbi:MAG: ATP-binding protein [Cyanobacteriota bacterium]|nr:ATP-binding protein [Cyanobacteriota bacterium]